MKKTNFDDLYERIDKFIATATDEEFNLALKKANFDYYNDIKVNVFSDEFSLENKVPMRINSVSYAAENIHFKGLTVDISSSYASNDMEYSLAA